MLTGVWCNQTRAQKARNKFATLSYTVWLTGVCAVKLMHKRKGQVCNSKLDRFATEIENYKKMFGASKVNKMSKLFGLRDHIRKK